MNRIDCLRAPLNEVKQMLLQLTAGFLNVAASKLAASSSPCSSAPGRLILVKIQGTQKYDSKTTSLWRGLLPLKLCLNKPKPWTCSWICLKQLRSLMVWCLMHESVRKDKDFAMSTRRWAYFGAMPACVFGKRGRWKKQLLGNLGQKIVEKQVFASRTKATSQPASLCSNQQPTASQ